MSIDNLIDDLTSEGVKKALPKPFIQTLYWFVPTFILIAMATYFMGIRHDMHDKMYQGFYLLELISLAVTILVCTFTAFSYSRPDLYQKSWMIWVTLAILPTPFIFGCLGASEFLSMVSFEESLHNHMGQKCATCVTLFAIPSVIALFTMLRLGTSPHPGVTGFLAAIASTLLSYTVLRVNEANDNPAHIIVWHVFPVVMIAAIGFVAGYFILRWKK